MRRIFFAIFAIPLTIGTTAGCTCLNPFHDTITGSGVLTTIRKDFVDFSRIELSHSFRGTINRAEGYQIELRTDDNIVPYLLVSKIGETLKISLESGHDYQHTTLQADITLPDLRGLKLSGASTAETSGFSSYHAFDSRISGASMLSGSLFAGDMDLSLSGASRLSLKGKGGKLRIDASGASSLDLGDFVTNDTKVYLSGASRATIHLTGKLDGSLSGASKLYFYGNPKLGDLSTTGASRINKVK